MLKAVANLAAASDYAILAAALEVHEVAENFAELEVDALFAAFVAALGSAALVAALELLEVASL